MVKEDIYKFSEVLTDKELNYFIKHNLPIECQRNRDDVWDHLLELIKYEPLTEDIEIVADKLLDNLREHNN